MSGQGCSPDSPARGTGDGDDLGLDSLPAVRSSSSYSHWSQPWSFGGELEPLEPKLYGGLDTNGSDPDWTDTWSGAGKGSKHHLGVSVSGNSGLDWKSLVSGSKWGAPPSILSWSDLQSDVKEKEVELETKSFLLGEAEWPKEEEEEPVAVEDKQFANSFFWDDKSLLVVYCLICYIHISCLSIRLIESSVFVIHWSCDGIGWRAC